MGAYIILRTLDKPRNTHIQKYMLMGVGGSMVHKAAMPINPPPKIEIYFSGWNPDT